MLSAGKNLAAILPKMVQGGILNDNSPSVNIFDLDYFESRITSLHEAFNESFFTHCLAVKANPIRGVVQCAIRNGMGTETASLNEALLSLSLGLEPNKVIYDNPCKSKADLEQALKLGLTINLDNESEASVVDDLLNTTCKGSRARIGLRVNPVVGAGSDAFTSTATKESKFGLPITDNEQPLVKAIYARYNWLTGIHFHVGSQGVPLEKFVQGAKICMDFVKSLEESGVNIECINIGGGLSSSYTEPNESEDFSFLQYRKELEKNVPLLFSGKYQVCTEFGRSLLLKCGSTISKIEYVKQWLPENDPILLTHLGSNQFLPEVYTPQVRFHRFSVADRHGAFLPGKATKSYNIAGPLCFQGDFVGKNIALPSIIEAGHLLIMHDTGAYTLSMYSKFNSIIPSPVYGFSLKSNTIFCFKERETLRECLEFWGSRQPRLM